MALQEVPVQFTPIFRAYITSDYQETEILQGAIFCCYIL